jgi:gamma-glutamylcyclotransferase (GGCT)/AIG2-like uncharacterized protein YtfP
VPATDAARRRLETELHERFGYDHRLIVYGSLRPGRENHHHLAAVPGAWRPGWITGVLHDRGWGAGMGYPALEWSPTAGPVEADLFTSTHLGAHWQRLDRFEGADYERIVAPFYDETGVVALGNVYVVRTGGRESGRGE